MHERTDVMPEAVILEVDALADRVVERSRNGTVKARVSHLHEVLFEEDSFRGGEDEDHDPRGSYLPCVLRRRRGLPITLSLLYREVAARVGIDAVGIGAPGHFLVEVRLPEGPMIVDPFHGGRPLTAEEAFNRIDEISGGRVPRTTSWLDPVTEREWISRLIRNLVSLFAARSRQKDLSAMLELLSLVSPIRR